MSEDSKTQGSQEAAKTAMAAATDPHDAEKAAKAAADKAVSDKAADDEARAKAPAEPTEVRIVKPFVLTLDGGGTRFFDVGERVVGDLANHFYVRAHSDQPLPPPEAAPGTPGWAMMQAANRRRMDDLRRMQEAQALAGNLEGQAIAARRAVETLGGKT